MTKSLVIVESPAKAKTIEKFLGKDFTVKSSAGHVRDLPVHRLGVKTGNGFEPSYEIIKDKKKLITELKQAASKKDYVYLAPDPDREGEAIAWHLAEVLEIDPAKVRRIEFNEITKTAVLRALQSPRDISMDRVNAQQARRVLDRLVGYKLSPLLWKKVKKGLSAGRVQSVAVYLICEREEEIERFVAEEYWTIDAILRKGAAGQPFKATLAKYRNKTIKVRNKEQSDGIVREVHSHPFVVAAVDQKRKKRNSALPFITSTLQQEASRKLGWSAKKTMLVAQKLYEGMDVDGEHAGLITYMRTDSTRIADEARKMCQDFIVKTYGREYVGSSTPARKKKANVQDAHEAIRPTDVRKMPDAIKRFVGENEYRLYSLIWKRFVASQMAPAELDVTTVSINAGEYQFKAEGSIVVFQGFMTVYTEGKDDAEQDETDVILPHLAKGDELQRQKIESEQHFTKPPARYTEATLVKVLEEKGIGRPSTYAPIISTIVDRGYVRSEKKRLHPTELGRIVNDQLKNHFAAIINVGFTAEMESRLDDIMHGKIEWTEVLKDFYQPFVEELTLAEKNMPKVKPQPKVTDQTCELCGSPMLEKESRFGAFLACSAFPNCKNTRSITTPLGVNCPKCGAEIIEKKTKRGKVFFGCKSYPACDFAVWEKPIPQKCPECSGLLIQSRGKQIKCHECGTKFPAGEIEDGKKVEEDTAGAS